MWQYHFIYWLAENLKSKLREMKVGEIFSQNKDEVIIGFYNSNQEQFYWVLNWDRSFPHMRFSDNFDRAKRNAVDLFPECIDLEVKELVMHEWERSFHLELSDGSQLVFKLHGPLGNIIHLVENNVTTLFRNQINNDWNYTIPSKEEFEWPSPSLIEEVEDPLKLYPFFDKWVKKHIREQEQFSSLSLSEITKEVKIQLERPKAYLSKIDQEYVLHKLPLEKDSKEYTDPFRAINEYAHQRGKQNFVSDKRRQVLKHLLSEKEKHSKTIERTLTRIENLKTDKSFEHTADVIMANLHVFQRGQSTAVLFDFYQNKDREIKLKKDLSPQKTAEILYSKSKNRGKEIARLEKILEEKEYALASINQKLDDFENLQEPREIQKWLKKTGLLEKESDEVASPFKVFTIEGFQILVGKSASNNDLLTTRYAHKEDIWLHAKDVGGSHVVIKKAGKPTIPIHIIEKAAGIAAWYSKGKQDTLFPVIYTARKYVRKFKGLAPGQVIVDQSEVVVVTPALPFTSSD